MTESRASSSSASGGRRTRASWRSSRRSTWRRRCSPFSTFFGRARGRSSKRSAPRWDRSEHDGLADRSARGRRPRQATPPPHRSPRPRGRDHSEGPPDTGAGRQIAMDVEDELLQGLSATERAQLLALMRRALSSAPPRRRCGARRKGTSAHTGQVQPVRGAAVGPPHEPGTRPVPRRRDHQAGPVRVLPCDRAGPRPAPRNRPSR